MSEEIVVVADVGGTKISVSTLSKNYKFLSAFREETPKQLSRLVETLTDLLKKAIYEAKPAKPIGVGLAIAGLIDFNAGKVVISPNLPFSQTPLGQIVQEKLSLPVYLDNDANLAALGEKICGFGQGIANFAFLTLGTGIGGGVIVDNKILRGYRGTAGELGHMVIKAGGPHCSCGNYGCLESLASGSALERMAKELLEEKPHSLLAKKVRERGPEGLSGEMVAELARAGDPDALNIFKEAGEALGIGMGNILNIFNPELIVIGGGAAQSADLMLGFARPLMLQTAVDPEAEKTKILLSKLGNNAELLGAAALVIEEGKP